MCVSLEICRQDISNRVFNLVEQFSCVRQNMF